MLRDWIRARNSSDDPEEFRLSLVEHLEELRMRIIRVGIVTGAAWVLGWFLHDPLYHALSTHVQSLLPKGLEYREVFHSITEPFFLKMKLSFTFGLAIAIPYIVIELWGFISPGLKPNERRPFRIIGPLTVLLFFLGAYFCWLILPQTINWFGDFVKESYAGVAIYQEAGTLVFFVLNMMLGFGLGFQLPLVVYFLAYIGILPPEALHKYWRHAVVIIFFIAAIVTPSADPFTMTVMAIPLCILFMLSVVAVRITKRRQNASIESTEALHD